MQIQPLHRAPFIFSDAAFQKVKLSFTSPQEDACFLCLQKWSSGAEVRLTNGNRAGESHHPHQQPAPQ